MARAREQSPQGGQHRPVGRLQRRTVDLASECDLVPQDDDLNWEVAVLEAGELDQLEDASKRPVEAPHNVPHVRAQLMRYGWHFRHPQDPG